MNKNIDEKEEMLASFTLGLIVISVTMAVLFLNTLIS